jgi:hypothetical protein
MFKLYLWIFTNREIVLNHFSSKITIDIKLVPEMVKMKFIYFYLFLSFFMKIYLPETRFSVPIWPASSHGPK